MTSPILSCPPITWQRANQRQHSCMLSWRHPSTTVMRFMHERQRRWPISCNECSILPPTVSVRSWSGDNPAWRAPLAGQRTYQRVVQAWHYGVLLYPWPGTSIPRRPSHTSIWSSTCIPQTNTSWSYLIVDSTYTSFGLFDWQSNGLELITWWTQRSDMWFRQFKKFLKTISASVNKTLEVCNAMSYVNPRFS